jgi:hypothetical protein
MRLVALLAIVLVFAASTASAQTPDPTTLYRNAFTALVDGQRDRAARLLGELVTRFRADPLAARAQVVLDRLAVAPPPSGRARGEFILFQTLHGIGVGAELCVLLDCDGGRAWAAALVVGGGAGFGLSLLTTRHGIDAGHALLLDTAVIWGFANAGGLALTVGGWDGRELAGAFLVGQGLGLAAGELAWHLARPTPGEVATASSFGFWTGVVALYVNFLFDTDEPTWPAIWIASDVGLLGGAVLGRAFQISRGRSLLIDLGGIIGSLAGGGIGALTGDEDAGVAIALGGTVLGLGIAAYATRHWDVKPLPITPTVTPTPGGAVLGLGGRF